MNLTNTDRITSTVLEQSRIGRRVALLLAHLNEKGSQSNSALNSALPNGIKGEVSVSLRQGYVHRLDNGHLDLLDKGREVIQWLIGLTPKPKHWTEWEDAARLKQYTSPSPTKVVRIEKISIRKIRRHHDN